MKKIIDSPYCNGKAKLEYKIVKEEFRKEKFTVYDFYYKCEETGKEFITEGIGNINLNQIYNQYRERKNILFPEQVSSMRKKYGLSSAKMSKVLGFGPNTYSNYEKGEIPSDSNSTLLSIANEPEEFLKIIRKKESLFTSKQLKKIYQNLESEIKIKNKPSKINLILNLDEIPNEFTGYRTFQFDKFANMVIFFLSHPHTYITRLNKYLFYSDFIHFKHTAFSISGLKYAAIDKGPVPSNYDFLYNILEEKGYLEKEDVNYQGDILEKYKPKKKVDESYFNKFEFEILNYVLGKLKFKKTKDIIDITHKEKAWIENSDGYNIISYQAYAFVIKGI